MPGYMMDFDDFLLSLPVFVSLPTLTIYIVTDALWISGPTEIKLCYPCPIPYYAELIFFVSCSASQAHSHRPILNILRKWLIISILWFLFHVPSDSKMFMGTDHLIWPSVWFMWFSSQTEVPDVMLLIVLSVFLIDTYLTAREHLGHMFACFLVVWLLT